MTARKQNRKGEMMRVNRKEGSGKDEWAQGRGVAGGVEEGRWRGEWEERGRSGGREGVEERGREEEEGEQDKVEGGRRRREE